MDNQTLRNIKQNLAITPIKPIYADEVVVAHTVKAKKDDKGRIAKEGHLHLVFLDMTTQKPIEKIIISPITALGLYKALGESIEKIEKELKSRKMAREKTSESTDYIR